MKNKPVALLAFAISLFVAVCGFFFWDTKEQVDNFTKGPPLVVPGFIEKLQHALRKDSSLTNELFIGAPVIAQPSSGFYICEVPQKDNPNGLTTYVTPNTDGTFNIITSREGEPEVLDKKIGASLGDVNIELDRLYFQDKDRKLQILKRVKELNKSAKI